MITAWRDMIHRGSRGVEPGQGWVQSLETAAEPSAPAADAYVALAVDVRRALAELSEGDRRLLLARYWADMTHARSRISSECRRHG